MSGEAEPAGVVEFAGACVDQVSGDTAEGGRELEAPSRQPGHDDAAAVGRGVDNRGEIGRVAVRVDAVAHRLRVQARKVPGRQLGGLRELSPGVLTLQLRDVVDERPVRERGTADLHGVAFEARGAEQVGGSAVPHEDGEPLGKELVYAFRHEPRERHTLHLRERLQLREDLLAPGAGGDDNLLGENVAAGGAH